MANTAVEGCRNLFNHFLGRLYFMGEMKVRDFSLEHTLECGQVFRWKRLDSEDGGGKFSGLIGNTPVKVWQNGKHLYWESYRNKSDREKLRNYFSLDENLQKILNEINVDGHINKAIQQYWGLRLIRQQPWECLLGYVCSPRTKIAHISKSLDLIAENFGEKVEFQGKEFFTYPEPEALSDVVPKSLKKKCSLKTFKLANYIVHTAKKIVKEKIDLEGMKKIPYEEAHAEIKNFLGVGPKVADCVCLFSLEKTEAFPIDVWVKRLMDEFYIGKKSAGKNLTEKNYWELGDFAREKFGDYAGYAQEYLYYFYRKK